MSALTQWAIVAAIVLVSAAYAVRVLLPTSARQALARWLRARGQPRIARQFDGRSGCDACPNSAKPPG
jgi:hypothetical protein